MSRQKIKNPVMLIVLFALLAITLAVIGSTTSTAAKQAQEGGDSSVYMPWISKDPTQTPVPMATVLITNNTGGQLCFEVKNSGVGRQCTSGGSMIYGPFPPGMYTYSASSSRCGSLTQTRYFPEGYTSISYSCVTGSPGSSIIQMEMDQK